LPISARYKLDPCRFFAKAECKRAGGCTFSHDLVGNVHPRLQFLHGADEEGADILHEADEEGVGNVSSSADSGLDSNFAEEAYPQDLAHKLVPSIPYLFGVAVNHLCPLPKSAMQSCGAAARKLWCSGTLAILRASMKC